MELVSNSVKHVTDPPPDSVVGLVLSITEDEELLIDVSDPDPTFRGFQAAVSSGACTGLGMVRLLAEDITWGTPDIERSKTVRVRMLPITA